MHCWQDWPCVRGGVVARTGLIDEKVLAELPRVRRAVILGAGFDSRAYRLRPMRQVTVFEVDHPATQAAQRRVVQRDAGERAGQVRFVPVVFGTDDPAAKLTGSGFEPGEPTLVLWEGSDAAERRYPAGACPSVPAYYHVAGARRC
jgi:methyltransferase (TIGR00027 family)